MIGLASERKRTMQFQRRPVSQVRLSLSLVVLLILPVARLRAQNPGATLEGIVQDAQGGRIPLARIEVRALESSSTRQAKADTRGEFRLDDLQPGEYRVIVDASGFTEARSDVTVAVSTARDLTVTMEPSV